MNRRSLYITAFTKPFSCSAGRCAQSNIIIGVIIAVQGNNASNNRRFSSTWTAGQYGKGFIKKITYSRFLFIFISNRKISFNFFQTLFKIISNRFNLIHIRKA